MKSYFLFLAIGLLTQNSRGAEITVKAVMEPGKPAQLIYSDGRVATMFIGVREVLPIKVPYQIAENNCFPGVLMRGEHSTGVGFDQLNMIWTEHFDPEKKGKLVLFSQPGGQPQSIDAFNFFGANSKNRTPKIAARLPDDVFVGTDFSWAVSAGTVAPESLEIVRWDSEFMSVNPETGLTENRTFNIALDVTLSKTPEGNLKIGKVGRYTGDGIGAFGGDIWAMIVKTPQGDFCDISIKPNFVGLDALLINYLSITPKFEPYLWGTDEYSSPEINIIVNVVFQHPEMYEAK